MENIPFSITLWVIWGRKEMANAKLLENIFHQVILEFCSIAWQYEVRAHVNRQVIIDENMNNGICFLVRDEEATGHPIKWSMIISICWLPDMEMLRSET